MCANIGNGGDDFGAVHGTYLARDRRVALELPVQNGHIPAMTPSPLRQAISAAYLEDAETVAGRIIAKARLSPSERTAAEALALDLVLRTRETRGEQTGVEALMQEYALSTQEGVVLMCLAEALLRVPDAATADK